jgi:hypothetical protein
MSSDSTDPRLQILQKWSDEGLLEQAGFAKTGLASAYDDDESLSRAKLGTVFLASDVAKTAREEIKKLNGDSKTEETAAEKQKGKNTGSDHAAGYTKLILQLIQLLGELLKTTPNQNKHGKKGLKLGKASPENKQRSYDIARKALLDSHTTALSIATSAISTLTIPAELAQLKTDMANASSDEEVAAVNASVVNFLTFIGKGNSKVRHHILRNKTGSTDYDTIYNTLNSAKRLRVFLYLLTGYIDSRNTALKTNALYAKIKESSRDLHDTIELFNQCINALVAKKKD